MLLGRLEALVSSILIGIGEEIFEVVDDGDVERAARASSDFFAEHKVFLRDLEQVPARARVRVRLQLLVPLHVLDLHIVVRHRFALSALSFRLWGGLFRSTSNPTTLLCGTKEAVAKIRILLICYLNYF